VDPDRWHIVRELFLSVCELEPADRGAYLARECGGDADMRAEVEALLASSEQDYELLDSGPLITLDDLRHASLTGSLVDRRVGAYRILNVIASGGMGTVCLAERADEQYRKQVAVKLIREGYTGQESVQRFRNERQTLALLEHPNIARLLDGGITEGGILYLVMDYIEGQPIDAYCDDRELAVVQRVRLFRQVCRAVEYAHRNLVVHRDLKPSNILVTADGVPKLLDFGIAKLLQPIPHAGEAQQTLTGQRAMTPEYASPEQIRGEAVTTATDVYSLGVILYKLLTGHSPYGLKDRRPGELEQTILDTDPIAPSSVVWRVEEVPTGPAPSTRKITPQSVSRVREGTPKRLSRRLRGDLDNIVLMALRKEPQRRYATAGNLAADIDNYLAQLPVKARRDSLPYRWRKFVRRHTVGVAAAVLVVLSALLGAAGIAREARLAAKQRDHAVAAQAQAEAIVTFLEEMLTSVRPNSEGSDVAVREVLDEAAARIETQLDVEPRVKASLYDTIGRSYSALGLYDQAEPHLRRALELRRAELGPIHEAVVDSLDDLGDLMYATGDLDEAETLHAEALSTAVELFGHEHATTIAIKLDLAEVLSEHRDLKRADRYLREVLATRRRLLGSVNVHVAETLDRLAATATLRGDYAEAARLLEEALDIHLALAPSGHPLILESLINLAGALDMQGDHARAKEYYGQAEPHLRNALKMHRGALGDHHVMTLILINELGELLYAMDRPDEALQLFRRALTVSSEMIDEKQQVSKRARNNHATLQVNLATVLQDRGDIDDAEQLFQAALATRREQLGPVHLDVADILESLAEIALQRGDTEKSKEALEHTLRIRREFLGENHPILTDTEAKIAAIAGDRHETE
jgi:serine/threonine-protein kinase